MLKPYELIRLAAEPFLPYIHAKVRGELRGLVTPGSRILDVGGRRSPYTIGLPASVTVLDLPRTSDVQRQLHLGLTDQMLQDLRRRRSNVTDVVLEDMTRCTLPDASFDGVVAVEVIEHVPEDEAFVAQVARVLRPDGWFCLTTPNGDYVKNEAPHYNRDHIRHYQRAELEALLRRHFHDVDVVYAIATGKNRVRGLRTIDPRKPARAVGTMLGNLASRLESRGVEERARRTAHLIAVARRPLRTAASRPRT